jgi:hypothetical protein
MMPTLPAAPTAPSGAIRRDLEIASLTELLQMLSR